METCLPAGRAQNVIPTGDLPKARENDNEKLRGNLFALRNIKINNLYTYAQELKHGELNEVFHFEISIFNFLLQWGQHATFLHIIITTCRIS